MRAQAATEEQWLQGTALWEGAWGRRCGSAQVRACICITPSNLQADHPRVARARAVGLRERTGEMFRDQESLVEQEHQPEDQLKPIAKKTLVNTKVAHAKLSWASGCGPKESSRTHDLPSDDSDAGIWRVCEAEYGEL